MWNLPSNSGCSGWTYSAHKPLRPPSGQRPEPQLNLAVSQVLLLIPRSLVGGHLPDRELDGTLTLCNASLTFALLWRGRPRPRKPFSRGRHTEGLQARKLALSLSKGSLLSAGRKVLQA